MGVLDFRTRACRCPPAPRHAGAEAVTLFPEETLPLRLSISDVIALGRDEIDAGVREALASHDGLSWDVAVFWHPDRSAYSVRMRRNGVRLDPPPSVPAFLAFEHADQIGLQRAVREYVEACILQ
jgi:hypothetical protein